jgi:death-on-curing protein
MPLFRYLTVAEAIALYDEAMAESGQPSAPLVREDALQRALHHPRNLAYYEDAGLAEQAVDLALEIALAHAWVDGNKRISVYCFRIFLQANGLATPDRAALLEFAKAFVETVGAKPEDRATLIADLVELVQSWIDSGDSKDR